MLVPVRALSESITRYRRLSDDERDEVNLAFVISNTVEITL